jgi:acetylornithine deacetylase
VAAEQLVAAGVRGRLVLALVADEEDASLGTAGVLEALGDVPMDVCLVAEPTWLNLAVAHRGYAVIKVGLHGRAAHSSQPEQGVDVLAQLRRFPVAVADAVSRFLAGSAP